MKRGDDPVFRATHRLRCPHEGCPVDVEERAESTESQAKAEDLAALRAWRSFNDARHDHAPGVSGSSSS